MSRKRKGLLGGALCLMALLLFLSLRADRHYYLVSTLVLVDTMLPFFFLFEKRHPQARDLAVIAVMSAIAIVSRVIFIWLPNFKPVYGIVMITGIGLGPEAGFLTGAVSAFVSNFIFGQGAWTPWQMAAMALAGFLAGVCFAKGRLPRTRIAMCLFGGIVYMGIIGPLLDTCSLLLMSAQVTKESAAAVYLSGLPVNLMQTAATVLTLALVGKPLLGQLDRVKKKYGVMEAEDEN